MAFPAPQALSTPELSPSGRACPNLYNDCGFLFCAGRAPRALSGWLASTTRPHCNLEPKRWKRVNNKSISFEDSIDLFEWSGRLCMDSIGLHACCYLLQNGRMRQENRLRTRSHCEPGDSAATITAGTLWEDLRPAISYLSPYELGIVEDALKLAFEAHNGQKRKSGEPYIVHPVEVARILGELELDWETIAAGLLHDTVEDTNVVTFERIEEQFGSVVRRIVEGETKVSKLGKLQCGGSSMIESNDVKADDLRQMFLAMTEEVRVIIVKLADRLHNMRTLMHMPPHKQKRIAIETLRIFAPLARLLGMYQIKSELEDLSFKFSHPNDYVKLQKRVNKVFKEHEEEASEAKKFLVERLADDRFISFMACDIEAHSFRKELYSIYRKLSETNGSIDEVRDISQLRIVLKPRSRERVGSLCTSQQICYHVLGLVHQMWTPVPQSVKDYIATPKPNGYQSLHTKVLPFLYENTFHLEVQIRTEEMDVLAERGIAVSYSVKGRSQSWYNDKGFSKGATGSFKDADLVRRVSWLNAIREWQEEFVGNMSAREFVDTVTGDLLGSRVFVFTPKGEIKNLPKGATVIDYAYRIHTELGNKMVAAKVNGNLVSPVHTLANAEVVEVITYNGLSAKSNFHRHSHWLQYAKTRSAQHKITKFLKEQAALFADELTADVINGFVSGLSESDDELSDDPSTATNGVQYEGSSLSSFLSTCSEADKTVVAFPARNPPKVNGKRNESVEKIALQNAESFDSFTMEASRFLAKRAALNLLPMHTEVIATLEAWQAERIALWQNIESRPILWLSVFCIDRRGMLGEVAAVLGASNVLIHGCAAESDRVRGLGIMLFNIEASIENLKTACCNINCIGGVLNFSVGCSWQQPPYRNI